MALLFDTFEVKNGCRSHRYNRCIEAIITSLTPERMECLADKHGITPHGPASWRKGMVGGSDDHSGLFIGRAFTTVSGGATLADFIGGVIGNRSRCGRRGR